PYPSRTSSPSAKLWPARSAGYPSPGRHGGRRESLVDDQIERLAVLVIQAPVAVGHAGFFHDAAAGHVLHHRFRDHSAHVGRGEHMGEQRPQGLGGVSPAPTRFDHGIADPARDAVVVDAATDLADDHAVGFTDHEVRTEPAGALRFDY